MDNVNHPPHYETGKYESIDVMEEVFGKESVKDFCLCNAFKYLYRCKHKHETPLEDVQKAVWYLNHYIELWPIDMEITLKDVNELTTKTENGERIRYDGSTVYVPEGCDSTTS